MTRLKRPSIICDAVRSGLAGNRAGRRQAERAGEDRQAAQDHALGLRQQFVAPVERRPQRLLSRQGCSPATGQDMKAIVEASSDLLHPKHRATGSRQLDGKREAVEPPTDRRNRASYAPIGREVRFGRPRPLDKQLDGAIPQKVVRIA